jgi:amino acid transporter
MSETPVPGDNGNSYKNDLSERSLDDDVDREELRQRYYGLLQELRVVLPGVQVLMAFLLTVPFAQRFDQLDGFGRAMFMVALMASVLSVIAFLAPTAYHRFGDRRNRSHRLRTGIRLTRVGLGFLALSLLSALTVVVRFVYGNDEALVVVPACAAAMVVLWLVVPIRGR